MSDLISKQAVIELVDEELSSRELIDCNPINIVEHLKDKIQAMPEEGK